MANAKISDDAVFVPETSDVRNITGLAGINGSGNTKITGSFLAQSVVNESGSGIGTNDGSGNINSRVAYYGVGNPSDTLAGSEGFQYYSANSGNSTPASLQLGIAGGNQYDVGNLILKGNYVAGSDQPELNFKFGDTTNSPKTFKITTQSDGLDQTWLLPKSLPTANQFLKVSSIAVNDVELEWASAAIVGGTDKSVQYNSSGSLAGDAGFVYVLQTGGAGDTRNRLSLGNTGATRGEVNIYGGLTSSGQIGLFAPSDEGVTITVPTAPNDTYTITLPGDEPASNQILESDSSGNLSWINTPSSGGGLDAFNSLTVNTTTREADWNYSTDGVNVKLTPLDPTTATPATRTKITVSGTWPNGAEGYLLVDSTNSNNFELPANSLIENGLPQAFSSGLTKYHFVYDGTNYLWSRENAMVAPTYLPAAGVVTDNLVGFYDPATFTQYTFNNTYSVNVVNNLSTWSNSENIPAPVGNLTAYVDETDPQYDNYMGYVPATSNDPAYFDFRPDQAFGSDDKYFTSTISPSIGTSGPDVAEWSAVMWIKPSSSIPTTDMWIVDVYNGTTYDEGLKIKNKRLGFYQGSSSVGTPDYTNFPALNASNVGNDWMFVVLTITATSSANAQARVYIGNPATFAASGSTIVGYDGNDINIDNLGIYKFEFAAEVFDTDPLTSIFIGSNATSSASGSSKPLYDVSLGEVGIWKKALSDNEVQQMWLATKDTYNIV